MQKTSMNNRGGILFSFMLVLSLFIAGCSKIFHKDSVGPLPKLDMGMTVITDTTARHFAFGFSGGDYEYRDIVINTELVNQSSNFTINFQSTSCSRGCEEFYDHDDPNQAHGYVSFPKLDNGSYNIKMSYRDRHGSGILIVTDFFYEYFGGIPNGISMKKTKMMRIPDDLIWISFKNIYDNESILHLIDSLSISGDFFNLTLPEGNYLKFEINGSGEIDQSSSDYQNTHYFKYNNDFSAVTNAFIEWKEAHPSEHIPSAILRDALGHHQYVD